MLRFLSLAALLATAASAQTYTGALEPGDATLDSGEYLDEYAVTASPGQTVRAVVTSDAFDTYVIVKSSSGEQAEDDDCTDGETTRSCASFAVDREGRIRVLVTSFAVGETGPYRVEITVEGEGGARDPSEAGRLEEGDATLESGEFIDTRTVRLAAGEWLAVRLTSTDFDPYLIARAPDGSQEENDDCTDGDFTQSCLTVVASEAGEWEILVTSYQPGERGAYQLSLGRGDRDTPGDRVETGELAAGDETLDSGEYRDLYTVTGTGGPLVVDLRSDAFDPYLIVEGPDGERYDNDDHEGALDRSLLVIETRDGEPYRVLVTSYAPGETGRYRLELRDQDAANADGIRTESGELADGDEMLDSGEFVDTYTVSGVPGLRLRADLTSDDFDTYLALQTPGGETHQDDDGGGRVGHSVLDLDLTEPGVYTILVTSYAAGETGAYDLRLDLTERFGTVAESEPSETSGERRPEGFGSESSRAGRLDLERTITGTLSADDQRLASGEFMDIHTFDGVAGEPVRIELTSDAFDTYLIVRSPSGEQLDNDDFEGSQSRSVVEFSIRESGRYRVQATSYRAGEVGPYELRLSQADALRPEPLGYDRIAGLFVGISDYDRMGDLRWTADDAVVARDAMIQAGMDPSDGLLLTDRDATADGVRAALRRLAARTDDRTLVVLFYSGHGGQYARDVFQRSDPDGLDESIELFDAPMLDDELDELLATVPAARQLVVLDACYSGGFSKDVISRPGRMGLFSSEEDIVSSVAVKFEAGGYLSRFFSDAVAERLADEDGNLAITALELSHYLDERFVQDVRGEGARDMLSSRDTRPEHQKLVVDRGSVGLYESLFLFQP